MSWASFCEWAAYYQVEPWGECRADLRAGIIAAASAQPFTKKRLSPGQFMPNFDGKRTEPMSEEQIQKWCDNYDRRKVKRRGV